MITGLEALRTWQVNENSAWMNTVLDTWFPFNSFFGSSFFSIMKKQKTIREQVKLSGMSGNYFIANLSIVIESFLFSNLHINQIGKLRLIFCTVSMSIPPKLPDQNWICIQSNFVCRNNNNIFIQKILNYFFLEILTLKNWSY